MRSETVSILEGNNFVVSDLRGDIDASPTDTLRLFNWDTRFLSRWRLTVDGKTLNSLSTDDLHYFAAQFFLVPGTGTIYSDASMSVVRKRSVGDGFHEDITVANHSQAPVDLTLRLDAAADFADLFEVKDALQKKGQAYQKVTDGYLILGYRRESFVRETRISATAPEAELDTNGISFTIHLDPQAEWTACIDVMTNMGAAAGPALRSTESHGHRPPMLVGLDDLVTAAPKLSSNWCDLERTYQRSIVDLAALRFFPRTLPGKAIPSAGLPWFMTIFGRDTLITSLQALPFAPTLSEAALLILAERQGHRVDPFRDEEPGKILHEQRFGEMTAFEERPHSPYFGSADATPLFLVLLDEYQRWTGDQQLVYKLEPAARKALAWIDDYGDRDGDGYVEYERGQSETGLDNQCWKDSPNAILFADGSLAKLPRAAAAYFHGRLPEAFAGYPRQVTRYPVEYPTACSLQAWATGTPLLMLRAMLGLEPAGRQLRSDPVLPPQISWLELRGIFWRGRRADIVAGAAEEMSAPPQVPGDGGRPAHSARELFATLDRRVDTSQLAGLRGSCRFDVAEAGHWRVLIADGAAHISESADAAETIIDIPEDVLLRIARGEQNPITALLSGQLAVSGNLSLGAKVSRATFGV